MRGEHNFPAAENFAHINITKWFGGKTVEKFNKYPSQAVYVQHCVCVWYLLKTKTTSFPYFGVKLSCVCLMIAYRNKLPKVTQR